MLIVAIGFGRPGIDPFTSTCTLTSNDVNSGELDAVLSLLRKEKYLSPHTIDEIMIIDRDVVVKHYTFEDGLGQRQLDESKPNVRYNEEDEDPDSARFINVEEYNF